MQRHLRKLLAFRLPERQGAPVGQFYKEFQVILERNNQILELMADMGDKLGGEYVFDSRYIEDVVERLGNLVFKLISQLGLLSGRKRVNLLEAFDRVRRTIEADLSGGYVPQTGELVLPLHAIGQESYELAGGKLANLGHLRNRLMLPTPDGFVITTQAFTTFMQNRGLLRKSGLGISHWRAGSDAGLKQVAEEIRRNILNASLPRSLAAQILSQFDELAARCGQSDLKVALRSSGLGEDGDNSFAGQYLTLLNVARDQVLDGYRQVVASFFDPGAWRYRLQKGYREHEIAMAVGCQAMVNGQVSGVIHTFAPHIAPGSMVINAAWGLCELVVKGEQPVDVIVLDRRPPYPRISSKTAAKYYRLVPAEQGGTILEATPPQLRDALCLTPDQMTGLAQAALSIERYYKRPQEIEWSYDMEGNLQILQVRPLHFLGTRFAPGEQVREAIRLADVLFSNRGYIVQCGIGVGRIFVVEKDEDLDAFPDGAILVSRHSSPRFGSIMHRARGIITDVGSSTGHMATLAREYRVPTIVNTEIATTLLRNGDEVTLDATHGIVYRGYLYALNSFQLTEEEVFEDTYEYRLLRRLKRHVSRLNLVNIRRDALTPALCHTYHDISHFVHVKAIEELIRLSEKADGKDVLPLKRLESTIPLGLFVIDAGGGTECPAAARSLTPEQVVSKPLRELLAGMNQLGMWCTEPVSVDLGSFMASFTRTFCSTLASPQEVGRNLAVVTDGYANINLRLGYHFTLIDAYLSEAVDDNSIRFRFWGGVTEHVRRSRRAAFIAQVLERFDFLVGIHGDLVVGRLKKHSLSRMAARMRMLGGLVGYTRQLDACMHADSDVAAHAEIFVEAINRTIEGYYG